jgi:hypothetical protein
MIGASKKSKNIGPREIKKVINPIILPFLTP